MIQIFEPFGAAYEVMKRILFQPFDIAKWFVIGFAAFMSGAIGGGVHFPFPGKGDWSFRQWTHHDTTTSESLQCWILPVVIAAAVIFLVVTLVLMWVGARGRFIFTDCVVRNRAAIVVPWTEYRREGNSFFFFTLVVAFLAMVIVGGLALLIALPLGLFAHDKVTTELHAFSIIALVFIGLIAVCFGVFLALVTQFMVPIMYRRRCLAREAFSDVIGLFLAHPGPIILYALFCVVLLLALTIVSSLVTCLTCCIAGLPYISSVVFLPAFVWIFSFKLLFLRQFGSEYDVWAVAESSPATLPAIPPTEPPAG